MPSVIDELIVLVKLDPAAFQKGQAQVADSLKKTRNDANRAAKDMEAAGKRGAAFFSAIKTEALGLAAVLLGGVGIEEAVRGTTKSLADLGQQAKLIGESVGHISAFSMALEAANGNAASARGALQKFAESRADFLLGKNPQFATNMSVLGGTGQETPIEAMKLFEDYIEKNKGNVSGIAAVNRLLFGFDDKTLNALIQIGSRANLEKEMSAAEKIGVPTDKETKAAQELNKAFVQMEQHFETMRRILTDEMTPSLIDFFGNMSDIMEVLSGHMAVKDYYNKYLNRPHKDALAVTPEQAEAFYNDPNQQPGGEHNTGATNRQYNEFSEEIAKIEKTPYNKMGGASNKYAGKYQMGPDEIRETASRLGIPTPSTAQFLSDPGMQERFFDNYTEAHNEELIKRSEKYRRMLPQERLAVLAYAHNQGVGGALAWMDTGIVGKDAFGTPGTAYSDAVNKRLGGRVDPSLSIGASSKFFGGNGPSSGAITNVGTVNIYTPASNAKGIAADFSKELALQGNRGPN